MSPLHKDGHEPCFISLLIYDCTTFTSRVNFLNENTVTSRGLFNYLNKFGSVLFPLLKRLFLSSKWFNV